MTGLRFAVLKRQRYGKDRIFRMLLKTVKYNAYVME